MMRAIPDRPLNDADWRIAVLRDRHIRFASLHASNRHLRRPIARIEVGIENA
jgi:hypothetical protein